MIVELLTKFQTWGQNPKTPWWGRFIYSSFVLILGIVILAWTWGFFWGGYLD